MRAGRALVDLSPLRVGDYRRVWANGLLAGLGIQVATVAVLFQVWDLTRNPFWVGAIGLVQAVPLILFGLVGGPLADVLDRRRVALWSTGGQSLAGLALAGQLVLGTYPLPVLLGLVGVQSAFSAIGAPSRRTFVVRLLPRTLVPAGIALLMLTFQASMLVGPALGGLILGATSAGVCFLFNGVALGVAWWAIRGLPPLPPRPARERSGPVAEEAAGSPAGGASGTGASGDAGTPERTAARVWRRTRRGLELLADGIGTVRHDPVLRGSFLLDLAATLLAFPVALFPMVNQELFDGDPRTLGLFMSAVAVGGMSAGATSGLITRADRLGRIQVGAVAAWGVALLGFGAAAWSGQAWLVLGFLAVAGAADTVSVTSRAAMVQLATPDQQLGRVSAVEHVIGLAGPDVGNARAGAVAGLTTPATTAVLGAVTCLAVAGWVAATHREVAAFRVSGR
ncbi:MFS transporter [uncultured Ornithinimicrobium sp.]|uniref:MFS transporter n=1 Tax=uncultured Ornithinimicrobium sp. TaxID=259307 RepID=UPI002597E77B|nr:MFS transporter [uncultured Ornithinimicrobium sp.]